MIPLILIHLTISVLFLVFARLYNKKYNNTTNPPISLIKATLISLFPIVNILAVFIISIDLIPYSKVDDWFRGV